MASSDMQGNQVRSDKGFFATGFSHVKAKSPINSISCNLCTPVPKPGSSFTLDLKVWIP